ncbi:hypothetical protein OSTOST_11485 [Ostertagia ostertagi]
MPVTLMFFSWLKGRYDEPVRSAEAAPELLGLAGYLHLRALESMLVAHVRLARRRSFVSSCENDAHSGFPGESSSNVIVCIALDRLFSVFSATRHSPDKANRRIRLMLAAAWATAFIIGLPQLAVWRSYVPFQHLNWSQCLQSPTGHRSHPHVFQLAERPMTSRLDLLKRHLNYSDLLVIFIYVPSRACWLLTYDWRGGDLLCRVVKMMHTVAFQVRSSYNVHH